MCYAFYALAIFFGVFFPAWFGSDSIGIEIGIFWDAISFFATIVAGFFLTATASGNLFFYKDDKYLEMWGDLTLKMAYIASILGLILVLAGMAQPPAPGVDPAAKIGASLAVASISLLYGLLFKYMVIAPWLGCRKK